MTCETVREGSAAHGGQALANAYEDARRAEAYATLEFPGTYYLAYRDLPEVLRRHVAGGTALDFGCGTGRSTRFLRGLGFAPVGVDISPDMIARAHDLDPSGTYRLIPDADFRDLAPRAFGLVLSVFTFDNIPGMEHRVRILRGLGRLLASGGRIVLLDATPELYVNEWASFSTKPFEENAVAKTGDIVRTIITDVEDRRPVDDVFWSDEDYRESFVRAGLTVVETVHPLGREGEPCEWVNETRIAPWVIYVLALAASTSEARFVPKK